MRGLTPGERRPLVDGGPHERVPELEHRAAQGHQPCRLGRIERLCPDVQPRRRAQYGREFARVVRGSHQQQRLRLVWEIPHSAQEGAFEPGAHRQGREERLTT